jgi:hypothetical protein
MGLSCSTLCWHGSFQQQFVLAWGCLQQCVLAWGCVQQFVLAWAFPAALCAGIDFLQKLVRKQRWTGITCSILCWHGGFLQHCVLAWGFPALHCLHRVLACVFLQQSMVVQRFSAPSAFMLVATFALHTLRSPLAPEASILGVGNAGQR